MIWEIDATLPALPMVGEALQNKTQFSRFTNVLDCKKKSTKLNAGTVENQCIGTSLQGKVKIQKPNENQRKRHHVVGFFE